LRGAVGGLPDELPLTGLVVAPPTFFHAAGQKANAVEPARRLLAHMRAHVQVDRIVYGAHSADRSRSWDEQRNRHLNRTADGVPAPSTHT
jgi:hypothetical protein